MNDVQQLLAYEEIRQLPSRYALAMDSRDLEALVELFVEDVQVGRDRFGRETLKADFDRQLREIGISILFVGNHVIDLVDDDHARGTVYCKGEIQVDEKWIHQAIVYRDRYERREGRWLFVRRKHLLFYGTELGENPLGLEPAEWPNHHTGRGTLPEDWASWKAFWSRSNGD